jgi:hypothetical protein
MGANTADYAKQSGYQAASGAQNAAWATNSPQSQTEQAGPLLHLRRSSRCRTCLFRPQLPQERRRRPGRLWPPPSPSASPTGSPPPSGGGGGPQAGAPASPEMSQALQRALQIAKEAYAQQQLPAPSQGQKPIINADGKNTTRQACSRHAWRSMWACALMPRSAARAARSIMREKPGADSGAPRSETNTNGDGAFSRRPCL